MFTPRATPRNYPRRFNGQFKRKLRPYNRGLNTYRKLRVARKLSYDPSVRPLSINTVVERQHGSHMTLGSNSDITSFVEYPVRGINGDGRSRDYIKLLHLSASGVINVKVASSDQVMDAGSRHNGVFVMSLLQDMKPFLPDGVNSLPTYAELFGPYSSAYVNMHLLDSHKQRFRILGSVKKFVSCGMDAVDIPFKLELKLSNGRYPLWASFKDAEEGNCGGNYRNIAKNAIIVSYAFVSLHSLKCEPFVQFELRYMG
uniref:Nuclear shuttle protein n=1 Tax=Kudzu mosaic virus TaxID=390437 RepID=E9LZR0_9GEMI|nr:NSP protein [Kudzu mosaic virus]